MKWLIQWDNKISSQKFLFRFTMRGYSSKQHLIDCNINAIPLLDLNDYKNN